MSHKELIAHARGQVTDLLFSPAQYEYGGSGMLNCSVNLKREFQYIGSHDNWVVGDVMDVVNDEALTLKQGGFFHLDGVRYEAGKTIANNGHRRSMTVRKKNIT